MISFQGTQPTLIGSLRPHGWIIGHRGLPAQAPENTLASFGLAVEAKADMIEFDVTSTREGIPVVIHDATLSRTTNGTGSVRRHGLASLRNLDAGSWFHDRFRGEFVPTLVEVMQAFGRKVACNIEIKAESFSLRRPEIVEHVLSLIEEFGVTEHTVVSSFSSSLVRLVKQWAPAQSVAWLHSGALRDPRPMLERLHADALHINVESVSENLIRHMESICRPLRVYTVNQAAKAHALFAEGVQAVFTDDVRRLK